MYICIHHSLFITNPSNHTLCLSVCLSVCLSLSLSLSLSLCLSLSLPPPRSLSVWLSLSLSLLFSLPPSAKVRRIIDLTVVPLSPSSCGCMRTMRRPRSSNSKPHGVAEKLLSTFSDRIQRVEQINRFVNK